jgi:hypothetical protein
MAAIATSHGISEIIDSIQACQLYGYPGKMALAKNWLFSDTPKGATASAQIYSLIETAKANGQEPYAWLRHILERLPAARHVEDYEALLPWNCSPASASAS